VITIEESSRSVDAFIISREKSKERNSFARERVKFSHRDYNTHVRGKFSSFFVSKGGTFTPNHYIDYDDGEK